MIALKNIILCTLLTYSPIPPAHDGTFGGTPSFEPDARFAWIDDDAEDLPVSFFGQLNVDYEYIFPSAIKHTEFAGQSVGFGEGNIILSCTRLLSRDQGYNVGIGYTKTGLFWNENPFFNQENFDTFNLSLNGFTKCWRCLELKAGASINTQTSEWRWSYTFYNLTGWARYIFCTSFLGEVGLNLGATSRLGLKRGYVYPIVGVDFKPRKHIKMNLIFPIDMVIIYQLTETWALDLTGKFWNTRRRLGEHETISRGYFDYINSGIELGLNFDCDPYAHANIHFGTTIGTDEFRISNTEDLEVRKLRLKPSPYVGGTVWVRF